jgi:CBS domain-containing membrane protein
MPEKLPHRMLRHALPAMAFAGWREALRAAAGLGLGLAALWPMLPPGGSGGFVMIAPFGASAVLLFALPNSPLAQPWSALAGNMVSALVAVAVVGLVPEPHLRVVLAPALALLAMHLIRALHPPGGAVALSVALSPETAAHLGPAFALVPVGLGTAGMILVASAFAPLTGRRYPFRQPAEANRQGTTDPPAEDRLGLSRAELAAMLQDFRQSANIGVEDLARLIAAAETRSLLHHDGGLTAGDIMSRDLVTVRPDTALSEVADLFRRHGFTSLPVVGENGALAGMIFQIHLIRRGAEDARRLGRGFGAAMGRLLAHGDTALPTAARVMSLSVPAVTSDAPLSGLLRPLARGDCDAVPVVEDGRLTGIVTRTDLIAALARIRG